MLPSHASAEACRTGWPNAQPQRRDYCSVARHHQATLIVCVVCNCCATLLIERCVGLRDGSGVERPCAMIFTLLGL